MSDQQQTYSQKIKEKAKQLGLLACGISKAEQLKDEKDRVKEWLDNGMNADMHYMNNHFEKRIDPTQLEPGTKSVISVLLNYYPEKTQESDTYIVSKYAYGVDYHFVLKDKLRLLLEFINNELTPVNGRAFVDSAPVLDKAWAARAGLGWIGKNSNLISQEHGSFFFIGELLVDIELAYDQPLTKDYCGKCTRCIDACPTKAIVAERVVDARKCISYQTIENRGDIDSELKGQFQDRIFGCDICQDVCPWNLKAQPHNEEAFQPHPKLFDLTKDNWHNLDRDQFNEIFRKSAVKRAKFDGLKRNIEFIQRDD
ncbi:tRNA epoxyqueuosine(34) reductase QueG [Prolixibacteraceae bacterium JC049]|nr:tRNA epoxyqueuosine(34) reductase QueG [Prolixibacteraceae bacterium JC049]